jgi:hypothetical protein
VQIHIYLRHTGIMSPYLPLSPSRGALTDEWRHPTFPNAAASFAALACLLLFRIRRYAWPRTLGMLLLLTAFAASVVGCGGGGGGGGVSTPGTTAGTYLVTVTGTSGSISATTTITLTIS